MSVIVETRDVLPSFARCEAGTGQLGALPGFLFRARGDVRLSGSRERHRDRTGRDELDLFATRAVEPLARDGAIGLVLDCPLGPTVDAVTRASFDQARFQNDSVGVVVREFS